MDLSEFIARQLNDHVDSPNGVIQDTYTQWHEDHIADAIGLGIDYLVSLIPQEFTEIKSTVIQRETCLVSFCDKGCDQFVDIIAIGDDACQKPERVQSDTNNLLTLFNPVCSEPDDASESIPTYEVLENSPCSVRFSAPLPVGTRIHFSCVESPEDINDVLDNPRYASYRPLIAEYAMWWLYRSDTESRSNLSRAALHFQALEQFVTTKLLLNFSLNDEGYNYGRRRTEDGGSVSQQ